MWPKYNSDLKFAFNKNKQRIMFPFELKNATVKYLWEVLNKIRDSWLRKQGFLFRLSINTW